MGEAKPFASLSSSLLARKGQAKPAMRSQGFNHAAAHDDLGWNDMGYGRPRAVEADEPRAYSPQAVPQVVRQQEEIAQELGAAPEVESPPIEVVAPAPTAAVAPPASERAAAPAPVKRAAVRSKAVAGKTRAAFTLRLEPERHLKLRLACAVTRRSAQTLVTEALDALLRTMPEIDAAAGQLPPAASGGQH